MDLEEIGFKALLLIAAIGFVVALLAIGTLRYQECRSHGFSRAYCLIR